MWTLDVDMHHSTSELQSAISSDDTEKDPCLPNALGPEEGNLVENEGIVINIIFSSSTDKCSKERCFSNTCDTALCGTVTVSPSVSSASVEFFFLISRVKNSRLHITILKCRSAIPSLVLTTRAHSPKQFAVYGFPPRCLHFAS